MTKNITYIICLVACAMLDSCFTGVESTPRITYSDVKKEHIVVPPEAAFLADLAPQPPSRWAPGKAFFVADPRIALIFTSDAPIDTAALVGSTIRLASLRQMPSMMGADVAVFDFTAPDGSMLTYRTDVPYDELAARERLEVPFAVDCDLVEQVANRLVGKSYYITSPLWYTADGSAAVNGLRHVQVTVDSVAPGNANYPVRVVFTPEGQQQAYSVFMTLGDRRTSTRNFDTLFAFDDPRRKYPQISAETWALITHSRIKDGMTRDECRLALGAPSVIGQRPTTGGMVEYWQYPDGRYLLFEDGLLSTLRWR